MLILYGRGCRGTPWGKHIFWLIEATGMDANSYDMLNDGNIDFLGNWGGAVGPHGGNMKNWRFTRHSVFAE